MRDGDMRWVTSDAMRWAAAFGVAVLLLIS
jgi:hypothetical protein